MAWHRVDPRFLKQPNATGLTVAYVSHGERDTGHLTLFLDGDQEVNGFELAYDRFMGDGEILVTWNRVAGLRISDLDTGRRGHTMSPLVRYRATSPTDLERIVAYVERHVSVLTPSHGETVLDVLRQAHNTAAL